MGTSDTALKDTGFTLSHTVSSCMDLDTIHAYIHIIINIISQTDENRAKYTVTRLMYI